MEYTNLITPVLKQELNSYFSINHISEAQKFIEKSKLNVSFQKGSTERYFIISGIIYDDKSYESKIIFKKNQETADVKITSSCNCRWWNQETHCSHATSLFIKFHLNEKYKNQVHTDEGPIRPEYTTSGHGVHAEQYGTIVQTAKKLRGALPHSTFASLQYILCNKKIINFPLVEKISGKIKVYLRRADTVDEYKMFDRSDEKYVPYFSFQDFETDDEVKEISILDYLYLFNWKNGKTYHLPDRIKELIKQINTRGPIFDINEFLNFSFKLREEEIIDLYIDGQEYNDISQEFIHSRFSIDYSKRKNFIDFKYEMFDNEEKLIKPSQLFKLFTSEFGFLSSFRTKNDAANFIYQLKESLKQDSTEYKKHVHSASQKQQINQWVHRLQTQDLIPVYDQDNKKIYLLENRKIKHIFYHLFTLFGETAVRFSFFDEEFKNIVFQIPKNTLFQGIAAFYQHINPLGISIFYNKTKIRTWSSNIRFERNTGELDWFDLNLVVNDVDFDIINNTDVSNDFVLSKDGLVLLEEKEKKLLKFMKRYIQYEKSNDGKMDEDKVKKFKLNFKRSRIFELFELKKFGIEGALTPEEEELCDNLANLSEMPSYDIPDINGNSPRDYQVTGYNWLRFLFENKFGACLADDMGLGKTLQTIMFLKSAIDKLNRVLIVCPVSILLNWQNEIKKFSNLDIDVYYGGDREFSENNKILLTSYGVMKKESFTTFSEKKFDIVIFDEVQNLKNVRSLGANAARALNADFRICLTGTPVENDLSEFYNIMDLAVPGVWGDIGFVKTTSTKKSRLLARQTVRPFILRRTKDQVLTELPEKIENHVFLNFADEEREFYKNSLVKIKDRISSVQKGRKYGEILKSLLELRQLCLWQKDTQLQSTKIDFLMENLEQLVVEGHKTLVFSQFTTYLDLIQNRVKEKGYSFSRIDGTQSFKRRALEVEKFQEGKSEVFLISLKAGGVGLNLTAASYIFLMDPWWNPAVESQAIDRAHRIGQENKLTVYRPIIKDSVEEKVLVLQNSKRELFKDLMADDDESYYNGKLTMDDFQNLLS